MSTTQSPQGIVRSWSDISSILNCVKTGLIRTFSKKKQHLTLLILNCCWMLIIISKWNTSVKPSSPKGLLSGVITLACTLYINKLKTTIKISWKLIPKLKIYSILKNLKIWSQVQWRGVQDRIRWKIPISGLEKLIFRTRNYVIKGFYHVRPKEGITGYHSLKGPIFIKAPQLPLVKTEK